MAEGKGLGIRVGLHTAGMYPERLEKLLPWLDWVGFDVKAPFADYRRINSCGGGEAAREGIRLLLAAGVETEFRTTCHSSLLEEGDLLRLAVDRVEVVVARWLLVAFRPQGCAESGLVVAGKTLPVSALLARLAAGVPTVEMRAA